MQKEFYNIHVRYSHIESLEEFLRGRLKIIHSQKRSMLLLIFYKSFVKQKQNRGRNSWYLSRCFCDELEKHGVECKVNWVIKE